MKAFLPLQASSDQSRSSAHSQRRQPLQRQDQPREGSAETTQPKPTSRFGYSLAQIPIASPEASGSRAAGLSGSLRTRIERLSGLFMRNVVVHYSSPMPAQLHAWAYTQGSDIHLGPGQEHHLPHETWHVVQQMQGRVKPTIHLLGAEVNDDHELEKEADLSTSPSPVLPSVFDEHKTSLPVSLPMARDAQAGYERAELPVHHLGQKGILSERQHGRPALSAIQSSAVSSAPFDQTHIPAPLQTKIATPHAAAPVIQRAGPPVKTSIPQPAAADQSSVVPDLTKSQVEKITNAISDSDRLSAIQALVEDLVVNKGLLSTTDVPGDRKIITTDPFVEDNVCIKVAYKHGKDKLGLTYFNKDLGPNNDQPWVRMDIYEGAFSTPSYLYSTIRHELIHVAQRLLQPDPNKASKQDPLMYEYKENYSDTYKRGLPVFKKRYASKAAKHREAEYKKIKPDDRYRYAHHVGYLTAGSGSLQEGLQEAEAYLWELEHMEETGVPQVYSLETLKYLLDYLKQIHSTTKNLTPLQISYWEGYVSNITENIATQTGAIQALIEKWSDTSDKTEGVKRWSEVVQAAADLSAAWSSMRIIAPPPTSRAPGTKKLSSSMKKTKPKKKN